MLLWLLLIVICLSYFIFNFAKRATREIYSESYHTKMLVNNEYTRRVISDVYVAVTNNIYYLEHTLDNPDAHKETMARIVSNGTRIRSCGLSFIEDYYPQKGHHFCPYAWRNVAKPDVIWSENMGDADLDYLETDWFRNIIQTDSAYWSDPFYDAHDTKTALSAYMVPIHDSTGRTVAVLGADVSLDWLANKLEETDSIIKKEVSFMGNIIELKSYSCIINHDGTYITHNEEEHIMKENLFKDIKSCDGSDAEALINSMKEGKECENKEHQKFIIDGQESYVFFTPVKYTRWIMVTIVPCKSINLLGYLHGLGLLLIIALAMLAIVVVCHFTIKRAILPVKELTQSTDDMGNGKFDTPMPEMKHNDELCQLRDSIEKMQYALSNYVDEVKRTAAEATKKQ